MQVSYVLLTAAAALFAGTDAVLAAKDFDHTKLSFVTAAKSPLESTAELVHHSAKRHLRVTDTDEEDDLMTEEERARINGVVGRIISAGEKPMAATRAMKKPQKYQQWIAAGLSPSAVRVDVMKIQPWTKNRAMALWNHPDFVQYAKFMVKYEDLQKAKAIANAAT
ncbi:hypothetical protein PHYBOEH_009401 [Phytophthora boehmeriae]|uniref:RxLR effector protein n=1 Tax=Phytophthora boehmeriae TaxID=109152 RepID=A0A8T1VTD2_9STRA|nr:hypothetical protein PHYBOEH_009401 [Phytophthora boehmeriae]